MNGRSWPPEQKAVEDTWQQMDLLDDQIKYLKDFTSMSLVKRKNEMWKKLDAAFTTH